MKGLRGNLVNSRPETLDFIEQGQCCCTNIVVPDFCMIMVEGTSHRLQDDFGNESKP